LVMPAAASQIASIFTSVSEPRRCGFVCISATLTTDNGNLSGNILSSFLPFDDGVFAEARMDLSTGTAGVAVSNDIGFSHAEGSHFDTWFCNDPALCAALSVPGSFVPVTLNFHVSGSASLTPPGGFIGLSYTYDATSLLGSSALGSFSFNFFEDPGRGPDAHIDATATFVDHHTGLTEHPTVSLTSGVFDPASLAFATDFSVTTFIGGCTAAPCDLSQGIFTDLQSFVADTNPANDGLPEGVDSLNTFQVSLISALPLLSDDGRTAGAVLLRRFKTSKRTR